MNPVNKRILVPLALLALSAPTVAACGGGSGSEGEITATIEKAATSNDPRNCTALQTRRFVEQNSEQKGAAAVRTCEREAKEGDERAKAVKVSNVAVNGSKATAEVTFEGGPLDSQTLDMALVEEGGAWKLDHIDGFAHYDGAALGQAFEERFEAHPEGVTKAQARCIAEKVAKSSRAQAEVLFFSGSPQPIVELAEGCA